MNQAGSESNSPDSATNRAPQATAGGSVSYDAFREHLALVIGRPTSDFADRYKPLCLAHWDEIELADLFMAVEDMNPFFALPEDLTPEDASLDDLFYFCTIMGGGHLRRDKL
jgi:hypothetical protein